MSNYKFLENRSILLGKILRHNPVEINLNHDKYGWFNVEDVKTFMKVSDKTLENIVNFGKKVRYKYNEDKTKIRALQGHTFDIVQLLDKAIPNDILYHGTIIDFKDSILKSGLSKMNRLHVHLSKDIKTAKEVAGRRKKQIVILEIDAIQMQKDGFEFFIAENGVWLVDSVPTKYIKEI